MLFPDALLQQDTTHLKPSFMLAILLGAGADSCDTALTAEQIADEVFSEALRRHPVITRDRINVVLNALINRGDAVALAVFGEPLKVHLSARGSNWKEHAQAEQDRVSYYLHLTLGLPKSSILAIS